MHRLFLQMFSNHNTVLRRHAYTYKCSEAMHIPIHWRIQSFEQDSVRITNNKASDGAGIYADGGYVTLRGLVKMKSNSALGYWGGGAVFLKRSTLLVPKTNFSLHLQNNTATAGMSP